MNHQACENPTPTASPATAPAPVLSEECADAFAWSMLIDLIGHGLAGRASHPPHSADPGSAHSAAADPDSADPEGKVSER
ncbi:hypothetical protein ACIP10_15775 [Streptomyces galbus]|uniref:hypothetical protein n=1 Tax=Streptomyces galbus TaxID=33898 RepID=UPI00378C816E